MMLMMMYTGASRRAFQLAVAHEVEPKACTRRLWLPLYGPCVISEHEEMRLRLVIFIVYLTQLIRQTFSDISWI